MSAAMARQRTSLADMAAAVERAVMGPGTAAHAANLIAAARTLRLLAHHDDGLRAMLCYLRIWSVPDAAHAEHLATQPGVREVVAAFPDAVLSHRPLGIDAIMIEHAVLRELLRDMLDASAADDASRFDAAQQRAIRFFEPAGRVAEAQTIAQSHDAFRDDA